MIRFLLAYLDLSALCTVAYVMAAMNIKDRAHAR